MTHADLTVIGGGVIGLSIAWEAARRGLQVRLLERDQVGRGTSWTAAGILPPANEQTTADPIERLRGLSHRLHPQWAAELQATTGIDNGLRHCGGLYLALSPGEAAALIGLQQYWQSYDIQAIRYDTAELLADEPALRHGAAASRLRTAFLLPDEYQIRSPDHLAALRAACQQSGVQIHESTTVRKFTEQGRAVELQTDEATYHSDRAVLAGGAWSSAIATASGIDFTMIPVRGQMLLYRFPQPPFRRVINEGNRYFVPRDDGHLLVGSYEEEVGFCTDTTDAAVASLRHWAEGLMPELQTREPERTWAGLRPQTIDGFPYIGRVPGRQRLYVATGHFRSGIHLSCGTAVAIVDLLTDNPPPLDLDAFRIGRG